MRLPRLVLVALVSGSACVEVEPPAPTGPTLGDQAQLVISAQRADDDQSEDDDICSVLPVDGPCSQACDAAMLSSFVPPGTCAVFRCDLLDGRTVSVHACHPGG